jgi:hypothetical protein
LLAVGLTLVLCPSGFLFNCSCVCYYPQDIGALSELIFSGNKYSEFSGNTYLEHYYRGFLWITPKPATLEVSMTEADLSNKLRLSPGMRLGRGSPDLGAIIIMGAWISHKDMGALTSLNLSSNYLEAEGAKIVAEAIKVLSVRLRSFWHQFYVHPTTG